MARVFEEGRGKALSVSALGYPLGEGLLPLAVVLMIHGIGWRLSWILLGALMLLIFVPATQSLLRRNPMRLPWIAWTYLVLVGASQGMAGPMMTAIWAEVYGVQSLGATKSMVATFGVTATALGPLLLGAALGAGMEFPAIIGICLAICGTCTVAAFIGRRMTRRMQRDASVPS